MVEEFGLERPVEGDQLYATPNTEEEPMRALSPEQNALSGPAFAAGALSTEIDDCAVPVPHSFVTVRPMEFVPGAP